jgi:hypothetical protein
MLFPQRDTFPFLRYLYRVFPRKSFPIIPDPLSRK